MTKCMDLMPCIPAWVFSFLTRWCCGSSEEAWDIGRLRVQLSFPELRDVAAFIFHAASLD